MREKHEPYYTEEFNAAFDSLEEQKARKDMLREFLKLEIDLDEISSVLDYGGDRGQFIIDELSKAQRYVYEISETTPESGIISLESIEECRKRRYDLIMCCHVLEHVSYPMDIMKEIFNLADEKTTIYIELPYDTYFRDISIPANTDVKFRLFSLMSISPKTVNFVTKYSSMKIRMHEHINYFNGTSLRKMMDLSGFNILLLDVPNTQIGPNKFSILRCLARKKSKT
jgi:hypothetical protein